MNKKKIKNIDIKDSPLYGLSNVKDLLNLLVLFDVEELKLLSDDSSYNVYPKITIYYDKGVRKTKTRQVEAPSKKLKKVQKIFNKLLQNIITPDYVNAGRRNMNYIKNAMEHIDSNDMLCTDIRKFFPSTLTKYLIEFLKNDLKMSQEVVELLTELLTYDGHLPTGAPSSPLLTFWCYKNTFNKIYEFSRSLNIKMTLYVDDMTFSSKSNISKKLLPFISNELQKVNLILHPDKIKRFPKGKYKHVTGGCINKKHQLLVPNKKRYEVIKLIENKDLTTLTLKELKKVIGKIQAMQLIEPKIFQTTLKKLIGIQKILSS